MVTVKYISDASFSISNFTQYGLTEIISGRLFVCEFKEPVTYNIFDWHRMRQRQVCYLSYGENILASTEGDYRGYNIKMGITSIFPQNAFENFAAH